MAYVINFVEYNNIWRSKMAQSKAHIQASARYNSKTYKRYAVNTRLEYVEEIEKYKAKQGIESDSGIFNAALMYCIENNIDLKKRQ